MTKTIEIIVYGAYGQIGQAVINELVNKGVAPLLAGRDEKKLIALASRTNLPYLCFNLINNRTIEKHLQSTELFLNCAGSLVDNPEPAVRAAIAQNCHYLDVGGQFSTLSNLQALKSLASQNHSVICAGIGAECIPGECLAGSIKHNLTSLASLEVAYDIDHKFSAGSIKSTIQRLTRGNIEIRNGHPNAAPYTIGARQVLFRNRKKRVSQVPTGDLIAINSSTGCPNVKSYFATSKQFIPLLQLLNWLPGVFRTQPLFKAIDRLFLNSTYKASSQSHVWARGTSENGRTMTARVSTPDIYRFTVDAAVHIALYLLKHERSGGVYTPAQLMTWKLIENLPNCGKITFGDMNE